MPACATTSPRSTPPAPTASACSAPNSSSWSRRPCRERESAAAALPRGARRGRRQAGHLPHRRHRRRQEPALSRHQSGERGESGDGLARAAPRARPRHADEGAGPRPARGRRRPRAPGHVPDGLRALGVRRRPRRWSRSSAPGSPSRKKPLPTRIRYGAMLEVPSLAEMLDVLLPKLDFLSIGTNDLTQFLFAADRSNPRLAERYDWLSPAILRFLRRVVRAADKHEVPLGVCGEMGGRTLEAMALIGIGIRRLSITPAAVGPIKAMIRSLDAGAAAARARPAARQAAGRLARRARRLGGEARGGDGLRRVCRSADTARSARLTVRAAATMAALGRAGIEANRCRSTTRAKSRVRLDRRAAEAGARGQGPEPRRRRQPDPDPDPPPPAYRARGMGRACRRRPMRSASPAITPTRSASTAPRIGRELRDRLGGAAPPRAGARILRAGRSGAGAAALAGARSPLILAVAADRRLSASGAARSARTTSRRPSCRCRGPQAHAARAGSAAGRAAPQAVAGQPVTLAATGEVWLRITDGDGGAALFQGILAPGQTFTVPATAPAPDAPHRPAADAARQVGGRDLGPLEPAERTVDNVSLLPQDLAARAARQPAAAPAHGPPPPAPPAPRRRPPAAARSPAAAATGAARNAAMSCGPSLKAGDRLHPPISSRVRAARDAGDMSCVFIFLA